MTEEEALKLQEEEDKNKKRYAKPDSMEFRSHYVQKRRKDRKQRTEEE